VEVRIREEAEGAPQRPTEVKGRAAGADEVRVVHHLRTPEERDSQKEEKKKKKKKKNLRPPLE